MQNFSLSKVLISTLILGIFLLLPNLFIFLYVLFRFNYRFENKNIKIFDFLFFLYYSLNYSIMLANRPYYLGKEIGFGEDLFHYYQAFEWVVNNDIFSIIKNFTTIASLTGSGEPLFWALVKLISYFTHSSFNIHVCLTVLGLFLIYIAGNKWKNCGLLFVFLYTNTITFFAYQGSAIRAGFAMAFIFLAYSLFLTNKNKLLIYMSPTFHFSSIPLPLIIYTSRINLYNLKNFIKFSLLFLIMGLIFFYFSIITVDGGLGAKVNSKLSEENTIDFSSLFQFLIESLLTFLFIRIFKNKVEKEIIVAFFFFFLISIFILVISPSSFVRFYRYECIFMVFIYSSILLNSDRFLRNLIILTSFIWFIFLGFSRFGEVFAHSFIDFISYNLIYRFS